MSLRSRSSSFLALSVLALVCAAAEARAESSEAPAKDGTVKPAEPASDAASKTPDAAEKGASGAPASGTASKGGEAARATASEASPSHDADKQAEGASNAAPSAPPSDADSESRAHDLFKEARALITAGHFDAACKKFKASYDLKNGIGTEFNLADCYERVGKNASAATMFRDVAARSHEQKEHDRERVAHDRYTALEPKLDYIVIDAETTTDLDVTKDGTSVDKEHWGARLAIDPGPHEVKATASGKRSWSKTIDVPQEGAIVIVTVPELADGDDSAPLPAKTPEAPPKEAPAPAPDATPADQAPAPHDNTVKLLLLGGVGAGLAVAVTGFALYESSNNDAKGVCPTNVDCTMNDVQRHGQFISDARTARAVGFVGLGITGASLIAGGIIAGLRASKEHESATLSGGPAFGSGVLGAEMHGSF